MKKFIILALLLLAAGCGTSEPRISQDELWKMEVKAILDEQWKTKIDNRTKEDLREEAKTEWCATHTGMYAKEICK